MPVKTNLELFLEGLKESDYRLIVLVNRGKNGKYGPGNRRYRVILQYNLTPHGAYEFTHNISKLIKGCRYNESEGYLTSKLTPSGFRQELNILAERQLDFNMIDYTWKE